ncbi:unnamed protein product [Heterobilharzia americana]|nr:unnamed protein product [Heterobilharzia americana]
MTYLGGLGCTLVGLGPCAVLLLCTVINSPIKVILLTASGFFWLVSLLITSVVWFIVKPLRGYLAFGILIGVLVQEVLRFLFYLLIIRAESGLQVIVNNSSPRRRILSTCRRQLEVNVTINNNVNNTDESRNEASSLLRSRITSPDTNVTPTDDNADNTNSHNLTSNNTSLLMLNHHVVAYVSGLGFAVMSCIIQLLRISIDSYGPGIFMHSTLDSKTFFLIASCEGMCISMLHIFWSLTLFTAFVHRLYGQIIFVYIMHMGLAALSLMNTLASPCPELVCTVYILSLIGMIIFTYFRFRTELFSQENEHTRQVTNIIDNTSR